ncbi:pyridoxal phosphate-dependent aminotransferase [Candidatus Thorarchaeota archaeon]|nr:MAG: pyridoxal phosphate-dependent aminotransferase [Candidatus Thorarchaeota archaeon]
MDWTSHTMERIPESGTLKMFDLARSLEKQGKKVYHFEVGQPDFPTPDNIVNAGITALKKGLTRYTPSRGIPPLLDAIEGFYKSRGIDFDGTKNVIVTPGAKMALFQGILSTIDAGDDVLLLAPAWPTYRVMIRTVNAKPADVHTNGDYTLNEELLKDSISRTVSALIINSPNNPTGGVLNKEQLKLIHDLSVDHDFVVFSDEIYEELVYDGYKQTSMLEIDPEMEHTLVINGFSKSYAMTGWRLGYAIGNDEEISNMVRIQQNTTSCATSFVQSAGVEALTGDQSSIIRMTSEYQKRRDEIIRLFNDIEGVSCLNAMGAFYVFPDITKYGLSSTTLAELILKKVGICCTPGVSFGQKYDNHLRFSYATSIEEIREGMTKLAEFLPTLL